MKSIACWIKNKIGKCYVYNINELDKDIKTEEDLLDNITMHKNILEECIKKEYR